MRLLCRFVWISWIELCFVMSVTSTSSTPRAPCSPSSPITRPAVPSAYIPVDYNHLIHRPPILLDSDIIVNAEHWTTLYRTRVSTLVKCWFINFFSAVPNAPDNSLDRRPISKYVDRFIWLHREFTKLQPWWAPHQKDRREEIIMYMKVAARTYYADAVPDTHTVKRGRPGARSMHFLTLADSNDTMSRTTPYSLDELKEMDVFDIMAVTLSADGLTVVPGPSGLETAPMGRITISARRWDQLQQSRIKHMNESRQHQQRAAYLQEQLDVMDRQPAPLPLPPPVFRVAAPRVRSRPSASTRVVIELDADPPPSPFFDNAVARHIIERNEQMDQRLAAASKQAAQPIQRPESKEEREERMREREERMREFREGPFRCRRTLECKIKAIDQRRFYRVPACDDSDVEIVPRPAKRSKS
jgi:hypothetical protein